MGEGWTWTCECGIVVARGDDCWNCGKENPSKPTVRINEDGSASIVGECIGMGF